jgi:hypothetical protein
MKKGLIFIALFVAFTANSIEIPKKILGQYEADVPAFTFKFNDKDYKASAYHLSIILKNDILWYKCGSLLFSGSFQSVEEDGENVNVSADFSNNQSISFNLDMSINKKTRSLVIAGQNGLPSTSLVKREIVMVKKKNKSGFNSLK